MPPFPNPCPVCGADDEHEAWRGASSPGMVYAATFCPHPAEPGHGTGCCCAGRSTDPFSLSIYRDVPSGAVEAISAQQALEQRVAALEAAVEQLSQPEPDREFTDRILRVWPHLMRRWQMNAPRLPGTAARTRTGTPGATR